MTLTAQHIGQYKGSFEPQRANNFTFEVDIPYANGSNLIRLALSGAFLPNLESEIFKIDYLNEEVQFAGKPKVAGSGSIKMIDYVDQNTRDAITSWYYQVYNPTNGAVGLASQYKRDAYIITFGPEGSYKRMFKLQGCFPSVVNFGGDLSYSDGNKQVELQITIAYDKPIMLNSNSQPVTLTGSAGTVASANGGAPYTGV